MKFTLDDLWCLCIYFPWELLVGAVCAIRGWPFHDPWGWFVVGLILSYVYTCRKELML